MKFDQPLVEGLLLKRYKRFFADVEFIDPQSSQKRFLTIHVPNTGSLKSVLSKDCSPQNCWFSFNENPARKLKGTLQAVQAPSGAWVGVNTSNPNHLVTEAAAVSVASPAAPFFKHWQGHRYYKPEHKISKETRLDGVFYAGENDLEQTDSPKHYVEIKNTTLMNEVRGVKHAQFPDAVTERGQKHLIELMQLMKNGHKAELIFTVQRSDVQLFSVAHEIDEKYAALFKRAVNEGLIVTPVLVDFDRYATTLSKKVLEIRIRN